MDKAINKVTRRPFLGICPWFALASWAIESETPVNRAAAPVRNAHGIRCGTGAHRVRNRATYEHS